VESESEGIKPTKVQWKRKEKEKKMEQWGYQNSTAHQPFCVDHIWTAWMGGRLLFLEQQFCELKHSFVIHHSSGVSGMMINVTQETKNCGIMEANVMNVEISVLHKNSFLFWMINV
jgi:hypothetical protein